MENPPLIEDTSYNSMDLSNEAGESIAYEEVVDATEILVGEETGATNIDVVDELDVNMTEEVVNDFPIEDSVELTEIKNLTQGYTEIIVVIVLFAIVIGGVVFFFLSRNKKQAVPTSEPEDEENPDEQTPALNEKYDDTMATEKTA